MSIPDTSSPFISYLLTDQELIIGAQLNDLNHKFFQNRIAVLAEQLIDLDIDPLNPLETLKQRAYLKGAIDELRILIQNSQDANTSSAKEFSLHSTD